MSSEDHKDLDDVRAEAMGPDDLDTELEQYGVWVKSAPEDVENDDPSVDFDLEDLDQETLTDEEEQLLSDLEQTKNEDEIPNLEIDSTEIESVVNGDDSELPDIPDLDEDFGDVSFELEADEDEDSTSEPRTESFTEASEDSFDEVSLDDFLDEGDGQSEETPSAIVAGGADDDEEEFFDIDLDIDDDAIEESLDEELPVSVSGEQDMPSLDDDFLEIPVEDYVSADGEDSADLPPITEVEAEEIAEDRLGQEDFGESLDELGAEIDEDLPDMEDLDSFASEEETSDLEDSTLDSLNDLDSLDEEIPSPDLDDSDFSDLDALERDLSSLDDLDDAGGLEELGQRADQLGAAAASSVQSLAGGTAEIDLLQKIEQELLSIRDELSGLKSEISSLKSSPAAAQSESVLEDEKGFFAEDDEDETIALTGDELDNILNTADITEEAGEASEAPDDILGEMLVPEEGTEEKPAEEPFEEETLVLDADEHDFEETPAEASETEELSDLDFDMADLPSAEDLDLEASEDQDEFLVDRDDLIPEEGEPDTDVLMDEPGESEPVDLSLEEELELPEAHEIAPEPEILEVDEADVELELSDELELDASMDELDGSDLEMPEDEGLELEGLEEISLDEPTEPLDLTADLGDEIEEEIEISIPEEDSEPSIPESLDEITADDLELEEMEPVSDSLEPDDDTELSFEEPPEMDLVSDESPVEELDLEGDFGEPEASDISDNMATEIRSVLQYMDQLLEALPEEKIEEFAHSEHFEVYKKLFEELGIK